MMQQEFERELGCAVPYEVWECVEKVYQWYPGGQSVPKEFWVELYHRLGRRVFEDMRRRAEEYEGLAMQVVELQRKMEEL